ncbi:hypothetical protein EDE12_11275 [Methylosinus sp. sav-2]|uniref:hypothetical protein n=1 Tax=Methylosinus sp. sav-2 TaxID=2485168 RepID=UPI0004790B45|nr:hypothetical protein [Methylosinus sp. sav-2]TDX61973.1 hypothetical protein EDE12_11275 [Methylosinus sp. sav-2]
MADLPIIFSGSMIRALLDGRKTMTRRLDVERWRSRSAGTRVWVRENWWQVVASDGPQAIAPGENAGREGAFYRADWPEHPPCPHYRARPSIHMPRWASRLMLTVESVKIERLQEISEADALAEGVYFRADAELAAEGTLVGKDNRPALIAIDDPDGSYFWADTECGWHSASRAYRSLWESLHGADAWTANPWVAAITFRTIHSNIDAFGGADCPLTGEEVAR